MVKFDYFQDLPQGAALPCDTLGVLFVPSFLFSILFMFLSLL